MRLALPLVAFLVLSSFAVSPANSACAWWDDTVVHQVKKGETLYRIARMYGDTVDALRERNKLDGEVIHPGDQLEVEPGPYRAKASWYGEYFHGRPMANTKAFDMHDTTVVAHKHLPLGTRLFVGRENRWVELVVQDRGPYIEGRSLDLSYGAFRRIADTDDGVVEVDVRVRCAPLA